jgi:hypothetical protein
MTGNCKFDVITDGEQTDSIPIYHAWIYKGIENNMKQKKIWPACT